MQWYEVVSSQIMEADIIDKEIELHEILLLEIRR